MKFVLSLIICSQVAGACMDPVPWPNKFESQYDCLKFGYEESLRKLDELGKVEVNTYNMFIKFYCTPEPPTV
tara:strand:- start:134 stop:349 length:216 start_codon:yes stop_codon:yes gene_type:complete